MLAKSSINISFMTVTRFGRGEDAIMAIGLDEKPSEVGSPLSQHSEHLVCMSLDSS